MDPVSKAEIDAFQSKMREFEQFYTGDDKPLCRLKPNEMQTNQLKEMFSAMAQYEESRGIVLHKHQESIFHKVYIDEPISAYRRRSAPKGQKVPPSRSIGPNSHCVINAITLESDSDVDALCFALERCRSGKGISLHGIKSSSIGSQNVGKIFNAVAKSKYIKSFSWHTAKIGDEGAGIIARALSSCRNLDTLNLDGNNIGDLGAKELATMLRANSTIQIINLDDNNIGDSGAQHLADALIQNTFVKELSIWNNNFGESGLRCMVDALLHNHHCSLYLFCNIDCSDDLNDMKEQYLDNDKDFSKYHYAVTYLSKLNKDEEFVENTAFKKATLIQRAAQPKDDFEAWWFPVLQGVSLRVTIKLWETALAKADEHAIRQVFSKRKAIDLTDDDDVTIAPDGSGAAIKNQIQQRDQYSAHLKKVKAETKEDIEDANNLLQQQTIFTDKWQGKFDEVAKLAEEAGADLQKINEIRYRL